MYQDHLAEPQTQMGPGKGPVPVPAAPPAWPAASLAPGSAAQDWGHWVSRDFVKWARLPV